jgi:hypothetical protein
MSRFHSIFAGAFLSVSALSVQAANTYAPIKPFLDRYCVQCHGEMKQKGEVRLDLFDAIDGALWSDVYEQIHHADMPPEDELQPSSSERARIAQLVLRISRDEAFSISTGYRRLNRREYANTVRDLLGLKPGVFDPALKIFEDDVDDGFDTNADELVISNELLLEYLESGERSLRMALFLEDLKAPVTEVISFHPGKLYAGDRRYTTNKKKSTVLRGSGQYYPNQDSRKISITGNYRVTITAAGVDRDNYGKMKFPPATGPIKMGVGVRLDSQGKKSSSELLKTFDLKDEQFEDYETVVWFEKGAYPWVGFLNGAGKPASAIRQAIRQRKVSPKEVSPQRYEGPGVEVTQFKLEGPLAPEWPPVTYRTIFQTDRMPDFGDAAVRDSLIERFVTRAYRRPAKETDVLDYRGYLTRQHQESGDWQEAFIKTFAAVMASHDFLYIKEEIGELPPFKLASRLSYFLWSTMPDPELFELARTGDILNSKVYATQVERMLHDPRADEFVRGFATQWLSLDLLGTMPPDIKDRRYSAYHRRRYEAAFFGETLRFFRHVLFENQPVGDFLDSDYTFINDTLAEVYDLPFKVGSTHERVKLPKDSVRGGLLGHGSILALTSNGVETLPVTRGHWILDELLGTPPPAPPEEVPALVPDLNGVDTPRDQLVRHRKDPACFECHKRMDPLGLALENFDVIGRYRAAYETGPSIDPSGELNGARFANVAELRQILRNRESEFAKSLAIKLAEYAKGRRLNRRDHELVDQIVVEARKDDYRFKSLLRRLLLSKLMRDR